MKKWIQNWASPPKVLLAGLCVGALAMLAPLVVSAVAPPANSSIGNVAGANYFDAAGRPQHVDSNQVSTLVTQVGKLTLTSDNNKSAAPGTVLYMPHTLTNLGNGTDGFTITVVDNGTAPAKFQDISIYPDTAGTGTPSSLTPLCSTSTTPCSTGFLQNLTANSIFNFVVAYTIPSGAAAPVTGWDTATVKATATNASIYPTASVTNTDTVNTTTGAAFTATKSLAAPGVAAAGGGAWPPVLTTGKASTPGCDVTWPLSNGAGLSCVYTVYTINYQNNGAAAAPFSIQDKIPDGMTFVTGSAVWSGAGGIGLPDGSTYAKTGTDPNSIQTSFSNGTFSAAVTSVNPTVSGSISFVVLVNDKATVGQATTTNFAKYWTTSCDVSAAQSSTNCSGTGTNTNGSPFPITATYAVVAAKIAQLTPDSSNPPPVSGNELVSQPTVAPNGQVFFSDVITNIGNTNDTFNLTVDNTQPASGYSAFPAGTEFRFFHADGVTPLLDSNGDSLPDTGVVLPGTNNAVTVVLRATMPAGTPIGSGPYIVLVTATSTGNGALLPVVRDSVWDEVDKVAPNVIKVDLTNTTEGNRTIVNGTINGLNSCNPATNCDLGAGPSSAPTDVESTPAGTGVLFPLWVKNNDTVAGTYNLTAPSLPTGWTVKFVAQGGTCSSTALSQPLSVASGAQVEVMACVTPPQGAPVGQTNLFFKVTSTTDASVTDTITDAVNVTLPVLKSLTLTPATGNNSIVANGTVVQPATLTNTGNQNCGVTNGFNVTATLDSASLASNWSVTLYYDKPALGILDNDVPLGAATVSGPGNLSSSIDPSLVLPLAPNSSIPLLVKVFAPAGAVNGTIATVTVVVTDAGPAASACPAQTSKYTATVVNGLLRLQKLQTIDATCDGAGITDASYVSTQLSIDPGKCLMYRVIARNDGGTLLTNVDIKDYVPTYTTLQTGTGSGLCTLVGGSGTPAFAQNLDSSLECWGGAAGTGITLNPAGTLTMQFRIKVQQ